MYMVMRYTILVIVEAHVATFHAEVLALRFTACRVPFFTVTPVETRIFMKCRLVVLRWFTTSSYFTQVPAPPSLYGWHRAPCSNHVSLLHPLTLSETHTPLNTLSPPYLNHAC